MPLPAVPPHGVRSVPTALAALCFTLLGVPAAPAADIAPPPHLVDPAGLDRALLAEIRDRSELMANLEYLSDSIGPRLTGSNNLERASKWTAERMRAYGLENVRLEPWEIPVGWERGTAGMRVIEPETGVRLTAASAGWTPGTNGKITGEVVVIRARTRADLDGYKGKLKNAIVILRPPATVAPVTDLKYGPSAPPLPTKDEPKKEEPKKDEPKKAEPKKEEPKADAGPPPVGIGFQIQTPDLDAFLAAEGVACRVVDAARPHGLLFMFGQWRPGDRATPQAPLPVLILPHEHFALLFRLATRPAPAVTRVEVEATARFVPGPITVFNTVGEVRGRTHPEEVVVVGAHLDSWDLGTGTMDNATGSCVVLETARAVAELARRGQRPRRTIRFCLFTGEEQGLHGSKEYVRRHKDELPRHSAALMHDTGTGKVMGFGLEGRRAVWELLEPQLASLKRLDGWRGLDLGFLGGTDNIPFEGAGVPGFACRLEIDEYRLTHHTQTDTFDHAKPANLQQGAQVMAVTAVRIANLPELLPRDRPVPRPDPKKRDRR